MVILLFQKRHFSGSNLNKHFKKTSKKTYTKPFKKKAEKSLKRKASFFIFFILSFFLLNLSQYCAFGHEMCLQANMASAVSGVRAHIFLESNSL